MQPTLIILFALALSACGSTSKKLKEMPPLAKDAPVEIYYAEPNLKYEKICEIEAVGNNSIGSAYTEKEDFAEMFKTEARKCGADAVIFKYLHGYRNGGVTAYGTGVQVLGKPAGVADEDTISAFSIAVQTKDLDKVKEILANVPKSSAERAPTDDSLVNLGLYIATLDGLSCDQNIVSLLEKDYEARIPKFRALHLRGKLHSGAALCQNVMARSLPEMQDKPAAILHVNNDYVALLENTYDKDLAKKAAQYNQLLVEASKIISESCKESSMSPVCASKAAYLDVANKTKTVKIAAVKKNAQDVLAILK